LLKSLGNLTRVIPVQCGTDLLSMLQSFLFRFDWNDMSLHELLLLWTLVQETCQAVITLYLGSKCWNYQPQKWHTNSAQTIIPFIISHKQVKYSSTVRQGREGLLLISSLLGRHLHVTLVTNTPVQYAITFCQDVRCPL